MAKWHGLACCERERCPTDNVVLYFQSRATDWKRVGEEEEVEEEEEGSFMMFVQRLFKYELWS